MKFPKNKDNVFVVYRTLQAFDDYGNAYSKEEIPVGCFRTLEGADNFAAACQQDMLDRNITEYVFGVGALVYYDE